MGSGWSWGIETHLNNSTGGTGMLFVRPSADLFFLPRSSERRRLTVARLARAGDALRFRPAIAPRRDVDVLSKDRAKFQQTGDEKYIDKARRRGKIDWNAGRQMEVDPHYRRPHMLLA